MNTDDLLRPEALLPRLTTAAGRVDVHSLAECDSTNLQLLAMARAGAPAGTLLIAERQTAGRGRRGRTWHQGKGALAFSLLWHVPRPPAGLSLAVGLAIAEALQNDDEQRNAQLKWPNDVLVAGRKVAGILIESAGDQRFVIGIGINTGDGFDNALPTELANTAAGVGIDDRTEFFARVLDHLVVTLDTFVAHGFAPLQSRWQMRNAYQDMAVNLFFSEDSEPVQGVCRGVDTNGELLLETTTCLQTIASGEVSLRLQQGANA
ncbi:MAG TPA: biotin--[acetyl-CoA-carboxylase] ligase [Rhodocyclaceae bacterium]|jgi:BirA family biotin operon repressor/biotin-[acetyl-CoA-carboxylase] ligase|nr:biotin--[acetyl-CoA-carboxylase] ligase [Rhodocyclaceae bacterium]